MNERYQLVYLEDIPIRIEYRNNKNINLYVKAPDGQVLLTAPKRASMEEIQAFIEKKKDWIMEGRRRMKAVGGIAEKKDEDKFTGEQLEDLASKVSHYARVWEPVIGVHASKWTLRSMKTRWGSCSVAAGRIRINTQLINYPEICLEYVVVHELCHLIEPSHNKRFKELMTKYMPDWRARKNLLKFQEEKMVAETMITYSGLVFNPMNIQAENIRLEDIAHALSLLCRGGGHLKYFYSVGQHSLNCAEEARARGLSETVIFACLLHDASEAYISDIIRPVKRHLTNYLEIEEMVMAAVFKRFGLEHISAEQWTQVRGIDDDILGHEIVHLMKGGSEKELPPMASAPDFKKYEAAAVEKKFIAAANQFILA